MTGVSPAPTIRACFPRTLAGRTSASTSPCRHFKDTGSGAVPVGGNVRITKFTWDPEQPRQKIGGIDQYASAGHRDPCPVGTGFIGDYFGLVISEKNVYSLFVSTHYPSTVTADDGGPVYYQQQVLATVRHSALGLG